MKNSIFLFTLLISIGIYAQCGSGCTITGPSSITAGGTRTFSTSATSGFSYFWSTTGGLSIIGSNTGSTVTVRGSSNGSVYITKFRAGSPPCCSSRNIGVSIPPPPCGLSLTNVGHLNASGSSSVTFVATSSLQSGWSYGSIRFTVTFDSGSTSTIIGSVNPRTNLPQGSISLSCTSSSTRVRRVVATITASSGSNSCTRTVSRNYNPTLCGSQGPGGGGIGFSISNQNDLKEVPNNFDIYTINGTLKFKNIDKNALYKIDEMQKGIYIIKYTEKGESRAKKIFVK